VADELIILDITATNEKRSFPVDLVKKIGDEAFMPFSVGGGINSLDTIKDIFASGAEKVVINTASVVNPDLISEAASLFGNQSIVVSIDIGKDVFGKYCMFISDGARKVSTDPVEHAHRMELAGAGEIMINSIDRDGSMKGYDVEFIKGLSDSVSVPVIACGGAGKMQHLAEVVKNGGASAAAAGSLFVFHGERKAVLINYPARNDINNIFS
jgi:cyclase